MTIATKPLLQRGLPFAVLALLWAAPGARAGDFPNDVKRTFTTDIPHFFQDDIPCAFGGRPTSGTKSSCNAPSHPAPQKKVLKGKRTAQTPAATAATHTASGAGAGASAGSAASEPTPPPSIPGVPPPR